MSQYDDRPKRTLTVYASIFVLLVMVIASGGYLSYIKFEDSFRNQAEHQISTIAELKVDELVDWRKERLGDANFLFHNPAFSVLVERYFENPKDVDTRTQLLAWLENYRTYEQFDSVTLLDAAGAEKFSVPAVFDLFDSYLTQSAIDCLRSGEVTFLDFHRNTNGAIHLSILVPIFSEQADHRPLGVLALRIDPQEYLYPYIKKLPLDSISAESELVRRDGNDVLFLNELRFREDAALTLRFPLTDTEAPTVKAVTGVTGIVQGLDYRGQLVLADIRAVPDSPWFLVSKMDVAEVYAPLRTRLWETFGIIGMAIIMISVAMITVWRQQRLLFYRSQAEAAKALRESEEKFRSIVENATDGIVLTDERGTVIEWNPAQEQIVGLTRAEVIGQPLWTVQFQSAPVEQKNSAVTERVEALFQHMLTSGEVPQQVREQDVTFIRSSDGAERIIHSAIFSIKTARGFRLASFARDVTERKRADAEILATKNKLQTTLDAIPDLLFEVGLNGHIYDYHTHNIDLLAVQPDVFLGKTFFEILPPDAADACLSALREAAEKGWSGGHEYALQLSSGERWFELSAASMPESDNSDRHFILLARDITKRKQVEGALARANLRLHILRLIDHALLGAGMEGSSANVDALLYLAELIPCGKISIIELDEISGTARVIAHVDDEKLSMGRADEPVLIGELRLDEMKGKEISVIKFVAGKLNPFETQIYDKGGRSLVKAPLIARGVLTAILVMISDDPDFFTEEYLEIIKDVSTQLAVSFHQKNLLSEIHRHAEELEARVQERTAEIETTRQRLELAVNAGEIGVWEIRFKEDQVVWNSRMYLMYGISPDDFDGSLSTWLKMIHPQDMLEAQKRFQDALDQTGLFTDEYRIVRPDGSVRHISMSAVVLYDVSQNPEHMIGVNVDVTDRKEAEDSMKRANLEMERALRLKDEFLANMSHELRTPLNAVLGISESLLAQTIGDLNEKQQKYISTINESGTHLLSLINDILDLSKIEAGRMELLITDVSVNSLFESCHHFVKEMALKKNVAITFDIDEQIKNVRGDQRRLLQMLANLLSNAVKFTPEGGKVGVQALASPELKELQIIVWDTGIGIAEEDIPRLFRPFVQLDSSLSRKYSGTGLGLMLVMRIANLHGGNVSVQSKLNEGSRFTISLPWVLAEQEASKAQKIEKAAPSLPLEKNRTGRVLLIDDTESVIMLLHDYLRSMGYQVLMARNGLSGVEMAKRERPDLILMDIQMPGMNGFEAAKQLRTDESLRDIPIIALTALAMPGDRERCLAAGMNDYISKPVLLYELTKLIERHIK